MKYELKIVVDTESLGEAITAVTPLIVAQRAVLATITPHVPAPEPVARRRRSPGGSPGSAGRTIASPQGRRKGQRMEPHEMRPSVMMLEALRTGPCTISELQEVIATEGYPPATAKSRMSDLIRSGHVRKTVLADGVVRYIIAQS